MMQQTVFPRSMGLSKMGLLLAQSRGHVVLQQVGRYLEDSGRGANPFGKAAHDPEPTVLRTRRRSSHRGYRGGDPLATPCWFTLWWQQANYCFCYLNRALSRDDISEPNESLT